VAAIGVKRMVSPTLTTIGVVVVPSPTMITSAEQVDVFFVSGMMMPDASFFSSGLISLARTFNGKIFDVIIISLLFVTKVIKYLELTNRIVIFVLN